MLGVSLGDTKNRRKAGTCTKYLTVLTGCSKFLVAARTPGGEKAAQLGGPKFACDNVCANDTIRRSKHSHFQGCEPQRTLAPSRTRRRNAAAVITNPAPISPRLAGSGTTVD